MQLRPYQADAKRRIYEAWTSGARNVLAVLPTGAGKTVIFSDVLRDHNGASCAIAHRQELVAQTSLALARDEVKHRIIGPESIIRLACRQHIEELGRHYYDADARAGVAGVDTLVGTRRRETPSDARWRAAVSKFVIDEGHHVLADNKWGKAAALFPNALGLLVTATPGRADGKGLGRHADGIVDVMIEGPTMRQLIDDKYLTDYRIFAPPSDYHRPEHTGKDGDFTHKAMGDAIRKSRVIGDVVAHYLRLAAGKLGVTFVDSVETAEQVAAAFREAGIPAAALSAKTKDAERIATIRRFRNREILQLVNVDLFGEGFDLPAIEVVSMARPTESFALYAQQFGRALRLMDGKTLALIIDHVGNVVRHGLPDAPRTWTLDAREKRSRGTPDDVIPVRACPECSAVYERVNPACPFCGYKPVPANRSGPEFVDGDLIELDAATLARMRGEVEQMDKDPTQYAAELTARRVPSIGIRGHVNRHIANQEAQAALRESIAWWAGHQRAAGRSDSESYRRFFHTFGVDVLSAQALKRDDALALAERVILKMGAV